MERNHPVVQRPSAVRVGAACYQKHSIHSEADPESSKTQRGLRETNIQRIEHQRQGTLVTFLFQCLPPYIHPPQGVFQLPQFHLTHPPELDEESSPQMDCHEATTPPPPGLKSKNHKPKEYSNPQRKVGRELDQEVFAQAFGLRPDFTTRDPEDSSFVWEIGRVFICYGETFPQLGSGFVMDLSSYDPGTQWKKVRGEWRRRRGKTWLRTVMALLAPLSYGVTQIQATKVG